MYNPVGEGEPLVDTDTLPDTTPLTVGVIDTDEVSDRVPDTVTLPELETHTVGLNEGLKLPLTLTVDVNIELTETEPVTVTLALRLGDKVDVIDEVTL